MAYLLSVLIFLWPTAYVIGRARILGGAWVRACLEVLAVTAIITPTLGMISESLPRDSDYVAPLLVLFAISSALQGMVGAILCSINQLLAPETQEQTGTGLSPLKGE